MQELYLHDMWFQRDGATFHTARVTMDLLRGEFGAQFISRLRLVNWPPKSCELMPLGLLNAKAWIRIPGQSSKTKYEKYSIVNFLSAEF